MDDASGAASPVPDTCRNGERRESIPPTPPPPPPPGIGVSASMSVASSEIRGRLGNPRCAPGDDKGVVGVSGELLSCASLQSVRQGAQCIRKIRRSVDNTHNGTIPESITEHTVFQNGKHAAKRPREHATRASQVWGRRGEAATHNRPTHLPLPTSALALLSLPNRENSDMHEPALSREACRRAPAW